MQTFRAYLQDDAGAITWAAWVEASDLAQAQRTAHDLCGGATPSLDLWFASDRRPGPGSELDPV